VRPRELDEEDSGQSGFQLGQKAFVSVRTEHAATILHLGPVEGVSGIWAGLSLQLPAGKNDGSIDGKAYFKCPPNHGLFARLSMLRPCSEEEFREIELSRAEKVKDTRESTSPSRVCEERRVTGSALNQLNSVIEQNISLAEELRLKEVELRFKESQFDTERKESRKRLQRALGRSFVSKVRYCALANKLKFLENNSRDTQKDQKASVIRLAKQLQSSEAERKALQSRLDQSEDISALRKFAQKLEVKMRSIEEGNTPVVSSQSLGAIEEELSFLSASVSAITKSEVKTPSPRKSKTQVMRGTPKLTSKAEVSQVQDLAKLRLSFTTAAAAACGVTWLNLFLQNGSDSSFLNFAEFVHLVRTQGKVPPSIMAERILCRVFNVLDVGNSGSILLDDFVSWCAGNHLPSDSPNACDPRRTPSETINQLKSRLNSATDTNGELIVWQVVLSSYMNAESPFEFGEFLSLMRDAVLLPATPEGFSDEALRRVFQALDAEKAGYLTLVAFKDWLEAAPRAQSITAKRASRVSLAFEQSTFDAVVHALKVNLTAAGYRHGGLNLTALFDNSKSHYGDNRLDYQGFVDFVKSKGKMSPLAHNKQSFVSQANLRKLFQCIDVDKSGWIDLSELNTFLGRDRTSSEGAADAALRKRLELHAAHEAKLSQQSLEIMKSKFLEGATVSEVFDKIDENHSNQLEYDEYLFFARNTCGITTDQISDQKLCQLFGVVDADNNGAIDLKELMQFIEAPSLSIPSSTHPRASLALAPPKSTKQVLKELRQSFSAAALSTADRSADRWASLFGQLDSDRSGSVDANEFVAWVRSIGISPVQLSEEQLRHAFDELDTDHSGLLGLNELTAWRDTSETHLSPAELAAKLVADAEKEKQDKRDAKEEKETPAVVEKLRRKFRAAAYTSGGVDWSKFHHNIDPNNDKVLDFEEFRHLVRTYGQLPEWRFSDKSLAKMFRCLDIDSSGSVNCSEFVCWVQEGESAQTASEITTDARATAALETLGEVAKEKFEQNVVALKQHLRAAAYTTGGVDLLKFQHDMDMDNSGNLSFEEFRHMIRTVGKLPANVFSDELVRRVFSSVDSSGNGLVSVSEFVAWLNEDSGRAEFSPGNLSPSHNQQVIARHELEAARAKLAAAEMAVKRHQEAEKALAQSEATLRQHLKAAAYTSAGVDWLKFHHNMDLDNSGGLSLEEFRHLIRTSGKVSAADFSDELVARVFASVDSNGDGQVGVSEFIAWCNAVSSFGTLEGSSVALLQRQELVHQLEHKAAQQALAELQAKKSAFASEVKHLQEASERTTNELQLKLTNLLDISASEQSCLSAENAALEAKHRTVQEEYRAILAQHASLASELQSLTATSAELLAAKNQAESSRDQALGQLELLRVEYQDYRTETAGELRSLAAENGKLASSMVENDVQVLRLTASLQTATTDTKLLRDQLANISYQLLVKEGELEAVQNDLAVAKMRVSNRSAPEKEAVAVSVRLDGHPSDFTDCKREQFLAEFARELGLPVADVIIGDIKEGSIIVECAVHTTNAANLSSSLAGAASKSFGGFPCLGVKTELKAVSITVPTLAAELKSVREHAQSADSQMAALSPDAAGVSLKIAQCRESQRQVEEHLQIAETKFALLAHQLAESATKLQTVASQLALESASVAELGQTKARLEGELRAVADRCAAAEADLFAAKGEVRSLVEQREQLALARMRDLKRRVLGGTLKRIQNLAVWKAWRNWQAAVGVDRGTSKVEQALSECQLELLAQREANAKSLGELYLAVANVEKLQTQVAQLQAAHAKTAAELEQAKQRLEGELRVVEDELKQCMTERDHALAGRQAAEAASAEEQEKLGQAKRDIELERAAHEQARCRWTEALRAEEQAKELILGKLNLLDVEFKRSRADWESVQGIKLELDEKSMNVRLLTESLHKSQEAIAKTEKDLYDLQRVHADLIRETGTFRREIGDEKASLLEHIRSLEMGSSESLRISRELSASEAEKARLQLELDRSLAQCELAIAEARQEKSLSHEAEMKVSAELFQCKKDLLKLANDLKRAEKQRSDLQSQTSKEKNSWNAEKKAWETEKKKLVAANEESNGALAALNSLQNDNAKLTAQLNAALASISQVPAKDPLAASKAVEDARKEVKSAKDKAEMLTKAYEMERKSSKESHEKAMSQRLANITLKMLFKSSEDRRRQLELLLIKQEREPEPAVSPGSSGEFSPPVIFEPPAMDSPHSAEARVFFFTR